MQILCVDDDALVRSVTADLLRSLGHDVVEAGSGRHAAVALRSAQVFDLLITDIHMPGGPDGLELAQLALSTRPGISIIYFSGLQHVLPESLDGQVLRKPCTLGELQRAIAVLSGKGAG